jgi:hypothetical protein
MGALRFFRKLDKAMKEAMYFRNLKERVGEKVFKEGMHEARLFLEIFGYREAKKMFVTNLCRAVLSEDFEKAKKYAIALEVLESCRRNRGLK